jgi:hypothetical protein
MYAPYCNVACIYTSGEDAALAVLCCGHLRCHAATSAARVQCANASTLDHHLATLARL